MALESKGLLQGKKVLLGVTGSISAYKACDLVQRLKDEGAPVRVIMTPDATRLVHPNTFAALTAHPVATEIFAGAEAGRMDHIELARWADIYLIAPCTAHTLGEFAQGLTGSLLSLVYLVFEGHAHIAPAMNSVMLAAPSVQRNLKTLMEKGDTILPTGEGILACGEVGYGKLLEVAHIVAFLRTHAASAGTAGRVVTPAGLASLQGKRVLISAGHTREKWDDVRYLSNRSSGKTALAIARAFHLAGAAVELVAGPMDESVPPGWNVARVETSEEFRAEMLVRMDRADVVVMAAAIADFVPKDPRAGKTKDSKSLARMDLQPFPNILSELGAKKRKGQVLVGFALETEAAIANAKKKLDERHCDLVVVNNPVSQSSGFGKTSVLAALLIAGEASPEGLSPMDKDALAAALVAAVAKRVAG